MPCHANRPLSLSSVHDGVRFLSLYLAEFNLQSGMCCLTQLVSKEAFVHQEWLRATLVQKVSEECDVPHKRYNWANRIICLKKSLTILQLIPEIGKKNYSIYYSLGFWVGFFCTFPSPGWLENSLFPSVYCQFVLSLRIRTLAQSSALWPSCCTWELHLLTSTFLFHEDVY